MLNEIFGNITGDNLGSGRILGYDFQGMAAQRMAHGYEPIDWPQILFNMFRAEAMQRKLSPIEEILYKGVVLVLNEQKNTSEKDSELSPRGD